LRAVNREEVEAIALLARLELDDAELAAMQVDLTAILAHMDALAEVDTTGVEPMAQPISVSNVLRDDVAGPALPIEKVLQNAPETDGAFFQVPKVIGGEEDSAG
jgi:aspartyl-tRNA(Asn)/glutamyl-tRNA(Gln) amidotransferase subunit C